MMNGEVSMFGRDYAVRPLLENEFVATWEWERPRVRYVAIALGKREVIYLGRTWRKELREIAKFEAEREFKEFFEEVYKMGLDLENKFEDRNAVRMMMHEKNMFMNTDEFIELYEEFSKRKHKEEAEDKAAREVLEENPDLVDCEFPGYYDTNKFGDLICDKIDEMDEEVGSKTGAWPVHVYFKLKRMAEEKKEGANDA